jgi:hypothetical protein
VPAKDLSVFQDLAAPAISITIRNLRAIGDLENTAYFLRLRAMATTPSPTRPVARSTSEAGSGTGAATWAFAVAGKNIPINIQYTDFINPPYFLRLRAMATIPSPARPVARSTREAGSGTAAIGPLAFAVAGKSMAAIIQYTDFINPPCRAEKRHYTWRQDSYHECKILKTNLLFYCDKERSCGTVKISYTQVMPSFVKKATCCESKMLIFLIILHFTERQLCANLQNTLSLFPTATFAFDAVLHLDLSD